MIDIRIILCCTALFMVLSSGQTIAEDSCSVDPSFIDQFDQLSRELIGIETALQSHPSGEGASIITYPDDNEQVVLAYARNFYDYSQYQTRINMSNNAFIGVEVRILTYNDNITSDRYDYTKTAINSDYFYKCTGSEQWHLLPPDVGSPPSFINDPTFWQEKISILLDHISQLQAP